MTIPEIQRVAVPLCDRYHVRILYLFGSRATGRNKTESDFDFCVSFHDLAPAEYSRCFFGLLHDLEDALERQIDLLTHQSIRKQALRESIDRESVRIYG